MAQYDYNDAGFDSFLSRSIDNLTQINLDSQGPVSTQMRYDSVQSSGTLGDVVQIGKKLKLNGVDGNITLDDENNQRLLLGQATGGF